MQGNSIARRWLSVGGGMGACMGLVVGVGLVSGCEPASGVSPQARAGALQTPVVIQRVAAPLAAAHCEIDVEGVGVIAMETDYLPNVVRCENGGADFEALKAQAIAARSVAYYGIETSGGICDSQGCQVYSCGGEASEQHRRAVEETSGLYLMYNDTLTYGFYVAGDSSPVPPACIGSVGATEQWVTYNEGRTGSQVTQTELGFVFDPDANGYGQNRGCMSQWGARCLEASAGYTAFDILRFYYGEDIEIVQGAAECVTPLGSTGEPATGGDDSSGSAGSLGLDTDTQGASQGGQGSSSGSDVGGASGLGTGLATSAGVTAADAGRALPQEYGETSAGCGCGAGDRRGMMPLGLWLVVLLVPWRQRTKRNAPSRNRGAASLGRDCGDPA